METRVRFAHKTFAECVELCLALDKKCFPPEMWLNTAEINSLLEADAWATTAIYNNEEIGLAITVTENQAALMLDDIDNRFTPNPLGAYSYSEAVDPRYQDHGIGSILLKETKFFISNLGFNTLSAHVRTKNGWDRKRARNLNLFETRPVENFWPKHIQEPVRFQNARI